MELTKEYLEQQKQQYQTRRDQAQNALNQMQRDVIAFDAAMQTCDVFLEKLKETPEPIT